jgi:uncharacterized protein (DUF169 family)
MEPAFNDYFLLLWKKYFGGGELPMALFYTDVPEADSLRPDPRESRCLIGSLGKAREGITLCFGKENIGCSGGKRYCGFSRELRPGFTHFLSYGSDQMEGERYKKTPELVSQLLEEVRPFDAPGKYLVVKRWDSLKLEDRPQIVLFIAEPDVLAGLFTLANYDEPSRFGVLAPMGAGCASIVQYPLEEGQKENPKCILGMFDPSARPNVNANEFSFAIPFKRFEQMVANMEESFLITPTWEAMKQRISRR